MNPASATLCQSCQMVLSVKTIPITIGETPLPNPKTGSRPIRNSVFLHLEGSPAPLEIRLHDGVQVVMGRHDPDKTSKHFIDLGAYKATEKGVSRKHAAFVIQDGQLKIFDLNSLNATFLNGVQVQPYRPHIVSDGDVVMLGQLVMTVRFVE